FLLNNKTPFTIQFNVPWCNIAHRHFNAGKMTVRCHNILVFYANLRQQEAYPHRPSKYVLKLKALLTKTWLFRFNRLKASFMGIHRFVVQCKCHLLRMAVKTFTKGW